MATGPDAPDWHKQLRDYAEEWRAEAERCDGGAREYRLMMARFVESFTEFTRAKHAERTLTDFFPGHPAFERISAILNAARGRRVVAEFLPRRETRWRWAWRWR